MTDTDPATKADFARLEKTCFGMKTSIGKLRESINGNGGPGLAETVRDHARVIAEWRSTTRWIKFGVIAALGGFLWSLIQDTV